MRLTAGGKAVSAAGTGGLGHWQAGVPGKSAAPLFNTTAPRLCYSSHEGAPLLWRGAEFLGGPE